MLMRITLLAVLAAQADPCDPTPDPPPDPPPTGECVFSYTMSGDGPGAEIKDRSGTVQSKDANVPNEIAAEACVAAGEIKIEVEHTSPVVSLVAPSVEGCVRAATASKNRLSMTLAVSAGCDIDFTPSPTSPGIVFPIKVRP